MNSIIKNGVKLRWKFEDISNNINQEMHSDKLSIDGIDWKIGISSYTKDFKWLDVDLYYASKNKNNKNWLCQLEANVKILNQCGTGKHLVKKMRDCLFQNFDFYGIYPFVEWGHLISEKNGFLKDDSIVIEIEFDFKYYDFSKNIPNYTDIVVNVEDTDFHLNRWVLSSQSAMFYDMFVNKKMEETVIKLYDIEAIDFCLLLASFDPFFNTVTYDSYKEIIQMAKQFGTPSVHYKCEQFLITYTDIELIEKIKYAEEYGYETLMKSCIESLKTGADITNLHANLEFGTLKETTKLRILQRFLEIF